MSTHEGRATVVIPYSEDGPRPLIWPVMQYVPHSLVNSNINRKDELEETIEGFQIELTDNSYWQCECMPAFKLMVISRRTVEVVWCAAYAYLSFYQKVVADRLILVETQADLTKDKELKLVLSLFRWALDDVVKERNGEWPDIGIVPPDPSLATEYPGDYQIIASEIALGAIGWMLHHELAHSYIIPEQREQDIEPTLEALRKEEEDADDASADWLIDDLDENEPLFRQRIFAIAVGLCLLAGLDILVWSEKGKRLNGDDSDHPPGYKRLVRLLNRHVSNGNHDVWMFALAIFKLHLEHKGIEVHNGPYDDARTACLAFAEQLDE